MALALGIRYRCLFGAWTPLLLVLISYMSLLLQVQWSCESIYRHAWPFDGWESTSNYSYISYKSLLPVALDL